MAGELDRREFMGTAAAAGMPVRRRSMAIGRPMMPVDATTFIFYGEVGPNTSLPGSPKVHVITNRHGQIFCTWTAVFTLKAVNAKGDAIFSGDGFFTVTGGTGRYKNAEGTFTTNFQTHVVPAGSDKAVADYQQSGDIDH